MTHQSQFVVVLLRAAMTEPRSKKVMPNAAKTCMMGDVGKFLCQAEGMEDFLKCIEEHLSETRVNQLIHFRELGAKSSLRARI